ncbi:shikimate dehydrogenase [Tomitella gaofuii]|uniref:shikimate dehydrogenase n=1 Tax=Tomitella gaofuii TaxID=2760083 RepID=UPI0015F88906|nr:shikimate dehydrogenase [Tomitella gaofuii]
MPVDPGTDRIRCALIGDGITASFTPPMHEREGAAHGLDYRYDVIDLERRGLSVDDLPELIAAARRDGLRGLNITHPCKQAVIPLLDDLSPEARDLGSVNTVLFEKGRSIGHNTDWSGFGRNLAAGLPDADTGRVVQLGAGGAGSAVAYAALRLGTRRLDIVDADRARALALAARLAALFPERVVRGTERDAAPDLIATADGLIQATPVGMAHHPGSPVDTDLLRPDLWVAEVIYRPLETVLLTAARAIGAPVVDGTGMAVGQAVDAFRIFTGLEPDPARMRAHVAELVEKELAAQSARQESAAESAGQGSAAGESGMQEGDSDAAAV